MKAGAKETVVGLFVLIGLLFGAGSILYLGSDSERQYRTTVFSVTFPNAGGIIKGSKILMAGVPIGKVLAHPKVATDGKSALLEVGLAKDYSIPRDSDFRIRDSGLLGDKYIDVVPNATSQANIADGDTVDGQKTKGISDLTDQVDPMIDQTRQALQQVQAAFASTDKILTRVDTEVLDTNSLAELKVAITSLNSALKRADSAFAKIDGQVLDDKTIGSLKDSIQKFNETMAKLDKAAAAAEGLVKSADGMVKRVDAVVARVEKGDGLAGKLLSDKQLAEDMRVFMSNLRRRGVLFYKDEGAEAGKPAQTVRGGR